MYHFLKVKSGYFKQLKNFSAIIKDKKQIKGNNMEKHVNVGNVLKIDKKSLVVVESNIEVSEDRIRGDSYSRQQFKTISLADFNESKENPNEKVWTIKDLSSMHGDNEIISTKIEIVDQVKLVKTVKTTYKPR